MWEAKRDRTGEIRGGLRDRDSLSWAVRPDSANRALPRSFTCSPLHWALVTGLLLRLLCFLLPSSPSHPSCSQCLQLSAAKLKTDESDHPVWKTPSTPTVQTSEGEGRAGKVVIFKRDFYWSGSKPPASCIKPANGEVRDMWNHELRQELRIMKLMSSCLHSAANIVIQTQKWNRNPGYSKEAAAETVLQVQVTSVNADLLSSVPPDTANRLSLWSWSPTGDLMRSCYLTSSPENSLALQPSSGISRGIVFPSAQRRSMSLVCNILGPP